MQILKYQHQQVPKRGLLLLCMQIPEHSLKSSLKLLSIGLYLLCIQISEHRHESILKL